MNTVKSSFFTPARSWLLASIVINFIFVTLIFLTTSLGPYVAVHALLILVSLVVLFTPSTPKLIFYITLGLSLAAALTAIFLTLAFASYYQQYINYTQSLGR